MILRIARHTKNINALAKFYTEILGLNILGKFEDHDGYNGVFIGLKSRGWHLEFTESDDAPDHHFDEDDSLVFYPETRQEYEDLLSRIIEARMERLDPRNPYWKSNGFMISDPDGFRIIVSPLRIKET